MKRIAELLLDHPKRTLACIALVKVLVFLGAHFILHVQPFLGSNATLHDIPVARRLVAEGRFNGPDSRPDSKVAPGYPAVMAAALKLLGGEYLAGMVVLQYGADLVTALAIYAIARRLARAPAPLLAAAAWELYPPAVVIASWITPETLFLAALTVSTALLLEGWHRGQRRFALFAGLALGASAYFRMTSVGLVCFYVPVWLGLRKYREALLFCGAAFLVVVPWTIRNLVVLDDYIPVAVGFGSVVLQGSDADLFSGQGKHDLYPPLFAEATRAGIVKPLSDKESGIDAWMGRVGLYVYRKRWHDRPLSYLPFAAYKFVRLWYGTETAAARSEFVLGFCSLLVVPWAAIQFYRWRVKWIAAMWLVSVQSAYFVVMHWIALPEIRYVLPLYPLLLAGAAGFWVKALSACARTLLATCRSSAAWSQFLVG